MFVVCSILGLLVVAASSAKGRRALATVGRAADDLGNGLVALGAGLTILAVVVLLIMWAL